MTENDRALGVSFPPMEVRRDILIRAAVAAEELGYEAFFVAEAWGLDAPVLIAEIATKTERILLGTCILNVWSRSAATLAMAATTLSQISGGRFILGLGASTPQLTEGLHDVAFASPLARLRRVVTQVRELLDGGRVPVFDCKDARPLRLGGSPAPVPIYLAALASPSVRLTGEIADGWMPFFFPRSWLQQGVTWLQERNTRSATAATVCRVCPAVGVAVAEDERLAREHAAWWIAFYLTTMGPLYAATLERFGYSREVTAVLAANPPRSAPVVPPEAESLFEELLVFGTPSAAREHLARWYEAGAALPIVTFPPNRPWAETEFALRSLAPVGSADEEQNAGIGVRR